MPEFHHDTGTGACSESSVCAGCLNSIDEDEYIQALNQDWHLECFRCSACDAALSNWYFEKDGLLFCKDDYWAKYGESCQDCGQVFVDKNMSDFMVWEFFFKYLCCYLGHNRSSHGGW